MSEAPADLERVWDLSAIYADDEAWEAAREDLTKRFESLASFRGKLGDAASTLADALELYYDLNRQLEALHTYASLRMDEDLREAAPRAMVQSVEAFHAHMAGESAWIDPEILAIAPERLQRFLGEEPRLAPYKRTLERIERRRPHTLSPESEQVLGHSGLIRGDGRTVSGILCDAEIPWETIELSTGEKVRLDPSGYTKARRVAHREDRRRTFETFHGQLGDFKESLGASLYATIKEHLFVARTRRFDDCLDAALFPNEVDPAVYHMLIGEIDTALPTLHRYLRLRGRILGIEDLAYYDIYPPLVRDVRADYSWETARQLVLDSLAPLGDEYRALLERALTSRWVDVDARRGKRSGAYVRDGAYDAHPYMLLNHLDDFSSASTIAHEAGHLMHSLFSQERQPYPTSHYVIFVAEVASTFNEILFIRHLLDRAEDAGQELALLGHLLENIRGTVFRQTMFAEFELEIHRAVERGEALTGESLGERYLALLRRYHGSEQGVMRIDDGFANEWAFVPHFHFDYYVYQYATSFVAATSLSEAVLAGDGEARDRYLAFLGGGSSRPPVDLLVEAGVDMRSPDPIRATIRVMESVMDRIESLLDQGVLSSPP